MTDTDQKPEDDVSHRMPGTRSKPHKTEDESIELRNDGEERFKAAVHAAAKSGPKHRPTKA